MFTDSAEAELYGQKGGANDMKIKRVLVSVLLVLIITACGKEGSSVEAEIDNSRAESVAQNLLQAMVSHGNIRLLSF